jgi:hypothetical protein
LTIAADIDIDENSISIKYNETALTANGTFNGYELDFSGTGLPSIAGADFDPSSTIGLLTAVVTFNQHSVFISVP